jgi:hypothetical protein
MVVEFPINYHEQNNWNLSFIDKVINIIIDYIIINNIMLYVEIIIIYHINLMNEFYDEIIILYFINYIQGFIILIMKKIIIINV